MTKEEFYNKDWKPSLYKIIFDDSTFGYYDFKYQLARDNDYSELPEVSYNWLKRFPFANYGNFKDEKPIWEHIVEIKPVYEYDGGSKEERELFNEYKAKWFEVVQKEQVFGINEEAYKDNKEIVHLFNLWLNQIKTQEMLEDWCTPMFGYSDVEVEDLSMVLLHCFNDAISYYKANEASKAPMVEDILNGSGT